MSADGGANNVPRVRAFAGQMPRKRIRYAVPGRLRAAWQAFRDPPSHAAQRGPGAMSTAVALATELAGRGDNDVFGEVLQGIPSERLPAVTMATAVLAATFAREWSAYEPAGPAELLQSIGRVAIERNV